MGRSRFFAWHFWSNRHLVLVVLYPTGEMSSLPPYCVSAVSSLRNPTEYRYRLQVDQVHAGATFRTNRHRVQAGGRKLLFHRSKSTPYGFAVAPGTILKNESAGMPLAFRKARNLTSPATSFAGTGAPALSAVAQTQ
ncbi:hypothetical protein MSAN_00416800 [Mycena sanguinolenta]|uniref:Uncharacterized protein n=1 Tax=Mycena sanguinolenta TaxID=230812 RepID=A0A8H6ZA46_9AGAR|nr:hypothetical protein MSAN_00416800 [Mycena sanguinolenta]